METQAGNALLETTMPSEVHELLKREAEIQGRSVSEFVVTAVKDAAVRTIESVEMIQLSVSDQIQFAEGLLNPPEPSEALREAFQKRNELFGPA